jgi:hypothetical protein
MIIRVPQQIFWWYVPFPSSSRIRNWKKDFLRDNATKEIHLEI